MGFIGRRVPWQCFFEMLRPRFFNAERNRVRKETFVAFNSQDGRRAGADFRGVDVELFRGFKIELEPFDLGADGLTFFGRRRQKIGEEKIDDVLGGDEKDVPRLSSSMACCSEATRLAIRRRRCR